MKNFGRNVLHALFLLLASVIGFVIFDTIHRSAHAGGVDIVWIAHLFGALGGPSVSHLNHIIIGHHHTVVVP